MRKIKYTNEAIEKLQEIKENISEVYGERVANNVVGKITKSIYELQNFAYIGSPAESVTGIPCN